MKVSIIVGTYSEEYDGHEYCLNVMARIRTALCSLPGMVLWPIDTGCNTRSSGAPMRSNPYPYWPARHADDMQTTWDIRTPQPIDKEEDF